MDRVLRINLNLGLLTFIMLLYVRIFAARGRTVEKPRRLFRYFSLWVCVLLILVNQTPCFSLNWHLNSRFLFLSGTYDLADRTIFFWAESGVFIMCVALLSIKEAQLIKNTTTLWNISKFWHGGLAKARCKALVIWQEKTILSSFI